MDRTDDADQILYGERPMIGPGKLLDAYPEIIRDHKIVVAHLDLHDHGHFQNINGYSGGRDWAVKSPDLPMPWKTGSDYRPTQKEVNELVATALAMGEGDDARLEFMDWPEDRAGVLRHMLLDTAPAIAEGCRFEDVGKNLLMMRDGDGSPFFVPLDQMAAIEKQCGCDDCSWHRIVDGKGFEAVSYTVCCTGMEVLGIIRY